LGSLEGVDRERKLATEDDALPPEPEVIPLFVAAPAATGGGSYRPRQKALPKRWAIAASVVLLAAAALALAGLGTIPAEAPAQTLATLLYTTDLGEQRSVTPADRSVVVLTTSSRLRVPPRRGSTPPISVSSVRSLSPTARWCSSTPIRGSATA